MIKPKKRLAKAKLKEDRFVILTAQAEAWFEKYRQEALYGVIGVIVLIGAVFAYNWSRQTTEQNASFDEMLARDAYARNDLDSALTRANAILEDYSGSNSAGVALMLKGRILEQRGQLDEAVKVFEEVTDDYSDQEYLGYGAYYALATIALGKSDYETAAKHFESAGSTYPKHFNAAVAYLEAGKAFEKAGKTTQAKSVYRKVLSDYPKSRSADTARDNLAKLEFMP
jgi:TolA-binding protein